MTFTASNGIELNAYGNALPRNKGWTVSEAHEARKEFYQHLRDEELGRWRSPEFPDYVVYTWDAGNAVRVVREIGGASIITSRRSAEASCPGSVHFDVARAYFEAHPAPKPMPTEPGLYVHRNAWEKWGASEVSTLRLGADGWAEEDENTALIWHKEGQLVRLTIEEEK